MPLTEIEGPKVVTLPHITRRAQVPEISEDILMIPTARQNVQFTLTKFNFKFEVTALKVWDSPEGILILVDSSFKFEMEPFSEVEITFDGKQSKYAYTGLAWQTGQAGQSLMAFNRVSKEQSMTKTGRVEQGKTPNPETGRPAGIVSEEEPYSDGEPRPMHLSGIQGHIRIEPAKKIAENDQDAE